MWMWGRSCAGEDAGFLCWVLPAAPLCGNEEVAAERTQHKNLAVSWLTVCFLFSQGHLLGISSYI